LGPLSNPHADMLLLPEAPRNAKRNPRSSFFWHANELLYCNLTGYCHGFDLLCFLTASGRRVI
jgi:hypothetical protein